MNKIMKPLDLLLRSKIIDHWDIDRKTDVIMFYVNKFSKAQFAILPTSYE